MSQPEEILTNWQRQETAQRILHDAELIKRGATISAAGSIVLGEVQLEYITLSEKLASVIPRPERIGFWVPDFSDNTPLESGPKEEWLDTPVNDLLARHPDPEQIPRTLRRRRLPMPVRELLVHGETSLHGLGQEARIALKTLINENQFEIEWKSAPTPEDIAHMCQHLGQVSAEVLKLDFASGLSINDVLQTPCDKRSGLRSSYIKQLRPCVTAYELDKLANGPEVFASRFVSERLGYGLILSGETTLQMPDE